MGLCVISFLALNFLPDSSSLQGLIYDLAKNGFAGRSAWGFSTWIGLFVLFIGIEFGAWRLKQPAFPGADVVAHGLHAVLPFISMNRGEAQQLGSVLVVSAIAMTPILQRLLAALPFRFLGAVSSPLYLCHLPVLATAGCAIFAAPMQRGECPPPA